MWLFRSTKHIVFTFIAIMFLVGLLFWLYLNLQLSMRVTAQYANIELSDRLPVKIDVSNYLDTQAIGALDTKIALDRKMTLALKGKYLTDLSFAVTAPISVRVDYQTIIKINTVMPLDTTTDLIYKHRFLPRFPLKINVPIQLEVPFKLNKRYDVPIHIDFDGPVYLELDEPVDIHVKHQFTPVLNLNDPLKMNRVASFHAVLENVDRQTLADLEMQLDIPLTSIQP